MPHPRGPSSSGRPQVHGSELARCCGGAVAARGIAPGLSPADLVTTLYILQWDPDAKIAASAENSLAQLDPRLANVALQDKALAPETLEFLARVYTAQDNEAFLERLLLNPSLPATGRDRRRRGPAPSA
ncbi:MAG: hypothetical protein HC923_09505 [Myxococcales bacterium]|nr:hypothetical protein [Myxococcales bacterium]